MTDEGLGAEVTTEWFNAQMTLHVIYEGVAGFVGFFAVSAGKLSVLIDFAVVGFVIRGVFRVRGVVRSAFGIAIVFGANVPEETSIGGEHPGTSSAGKNLFRRFVGFHDVVFEIIGPHKRPVAELALVRFYVGVRAKMHRKGLEPSEGLAAILAVINLLLSSFRRSG